ncbi:MAG: GH36 C-terminal domain-containing protein, partial [Petrimonas sp.]|nr:GH36 C-terminal domain-containing protein [Petrimonas sp.]
LKYRIDVASMGKLGFDIRANELSEKDMAFCQQTIRNYDGYKDIVWHGEMYRLASPYENDIASLMYVNPAKTQAVMFSYLTNWRYVGDPALRPVKLQGLDANKNYRLTELNLYGDQRTPVDRSKTYSGDFLMNAGFNPSVNLNRTSVVIKLEAI